MELTIDGSKIMSEADFHKIIAEELGFPRWYGNNLDVLWDALTGMAQRPLKVIWINSAISKERLSQYNEIISLLQDVEAQGRQFNRSAVFTLEID